MLIIKLIISVIMLYLYNNRINKNILEVTLITNLCIYFTFNNNYSIYILFIIIIILLLNYKTNKKDIVLIESGNILIRNIIENNISIKFLIKELNKRNIKDIKKVKILSINNTGDIKYKVK